jgi:hypothetical protein
MYMYNVHASEMGQWMHLTGPTMHAGLTHQEPKILTNLTMHLFLLVNFFSANILMVIC